MPQPLTGSTQSAALLHSFYLFNISTTFYVMLDFMRCFPDVLKKCICVWSIRYKSINNIKKSQNQISYLLYRNIAKKKERENYRNSFF